MHEIDITKLSEYPLEEIKVVTLEVNSYSKPNKLGFEVKLNPTFNVTTNDGEGVICNSYYNESYCTNIGTLIENDIYEINLEKKVAYSGNGLTLDSELISK